MISDLRLQTRLAKYFDVHSHIHFSGYDNDRNDVLKRMQDAGVFTITVGTDNESSRQAVASADSNDGVWATIGIHPTDNKKGSFDATLFEKLAKNKKVVGVGECGLDYFRIEENDSNEKKRQEALFANQIAFALSRDLPLMLHCRPKKGSMDAYEDVLAILASYTRTHGSKVHGNVHFFVGDTKIARKFLDLGFTLSFTGVITFAREYDEVVRYAPLSMILSETDCPFVTPVPYRGKRNEPSYVGEVVKQIAIIRREELESVKKALVENAIRAFDIPNTD